jgi:hypothetical protein
MYNHKIVAMKGYERFECICESVPIKEETIIFWPDDFKLSIKETKLLKNDLIEWCELQKFNYIIHEGNGR